MRSLIASCVVLAIAAMLAIEVGAFANARIGALAGAVSMSRSVTK
jgi:hypothetical protein